eukprot:COSAG01_NODE_7968_length_2971_cov_1.972493_1_plen_274_part_00
MCPPKRCCCCALYEGLQVAFTLGLGINLLALVIAAATLIWAAEQPKEICSRSWDADCVVAACQEYGVQDADCCGLPAQIGCAEGYSLALAHTSCGGSHRARGACCTRVGAPSPPPSPTQGGGVAASGAAEGWLAVPRTVARLDGIPMQALCEYGGQGGVFRVAKGPWAGTFDDAQNACRVPQPVDIGGAFPDVQVLPGKLAIIGTEDENRRAQAACGTGYATGAGAAGRVWQLASQSPTAPTDRLCGLQSSVLAGADGASSAARQHGHAVRIS